MVAGMPEHPGSKIKPMQATGDVMRNSLLRGRFFKLMVSLAICSISLMVFAEDKSGKNGRNENDDDHEGQHQKGNGDDDKKGQNQTAIMWINHLDLVPGDPSVVTFFNAVSSGVGSGLSGLIITSMTVGNVGIGGGGGNKFLEKGLQVPPGFLITGVRVCYELSNPRSFIDDIRLSQVQDPPSEALVLLDDATHQVNPGPVCVNSTPTTIDPERGAVRLDLRIDFDDISDRIVVRALGLHLKKS
jgi:hypothetical protein